MAKQIFKNRWFIWALAAIVIVGFGLWGFLEYSTIKMESENADNTIILHRSPPSSAGGPTSTQEDASGWRTYRSRETEMLRFNSLKPHFEIKYPVGWEIDETKGGLYLLKMELDFSIVVDWIVAKEASGDVLKDCKEIKTLNEKQLNDYMFDYEEQIVVNDIKSAYLKYEKPKYNGRADGIFVCVPTGLSVSPPPLIRGINESATYFTIFMESRSSEAVVYFNQILSTFRFIPRQDSGQVE